MKETHMKTLFYKDEGSDYKEPHDVANDDGSTIEFEGTEVTLVVRDDDEGQFATIYTKGDHFYHILEMKDVLRVTGMNVRYENRETLSQNEPLPDNELEFLGICVMNAFATGEPMPWDLEIEQPENTDEATRQVQLVEKYGETIMVLQDAKDVFRAIGAMVQYFQETKEYFDDRNTR